MEELEYINKADAYNYVAKLTSKALHTLANTPEDDPKYPVYEERYKILSCMKFFIYDMPSLLINQDRNEVISNAIN